MTYKKKLIEVALPLDVINAASQHEKSVPRRGHPATMHLWWARRPLAAARAVLWASLVDDPSSHPDRFPTEEDQETERQRLFRILEELVRWENSGNEQVLEVARSEIVASADGGLPNILDPFCGGGTIPIEAQRLGLPAHGGDLNPVAVLISKAITEIPPRFEGLPPVNEESRMNAELQAWNRAQGLAEDVRHFGQWMFEQAGRRIEHLYPRVALPQGLGGGQATVIAWIWARTVESPDPSWSGHVPLVRSWVLRKAKRNQPVVWVEPIINRETRSITYEIREGGTPIEGTVSRGPRGRCVASGSPITADHIYEEGREGRLGRHLIAVVAEGPTRRAYVAPTATSSESHEGFWRPDGQLPDSPRWFSPPKYGMTEWADLFADRQLIALDTFSELLAEVRLAVQEQAQAAGFTDDGTRLRDGGSGAVAYADGIVTYLAFAIDKLADWNSTICTWINAIEGVRNTFARQAIPMTWDYTEINPLSNSVGNFLNHVDWVAASLEGAPARGAGTILQRDASARIEEVSRPVISTDPPYYDNISYADLSDFFYVWLRRNLKDVWPDELSTLRTPKSEELIAHPSRAGSSEAARAHFESGIEDVFKRIAEYQNPDYPATVFYAFKQAVTTKEGTTSTGWETFIQGVLASGFTITATWPVRTERAARSVAIGTAALASSIVLACRPRAVDASRATRSEYLAALRAELPEAVRTLQRESIAPVDMAQSMIGPGMAVFSRYSKVLEADGSAMSIRQALALINQVLEEALSAEETEFDNETRWALTWYEQHGMNPADFGDADVLARAKDTSAAYVQHAGIASVSSGKVRLLARTDLDPDWDPRADRILTVWEITQHLIARLGLSETQAADLLGQVGSGDGERARQLAYLLFQIADRHGWSDEAVAYNSLVQAWPELTRLAGRSEAPVQQTLGE